MTIKEQYNEISNDLNDVEKELTELNNEEIIKKYKYLKFKKDLLTNNKKDLYKSIKNDEYNKCNHLAITTYIEPSRLENKDTKYCGCLKCGLDEKVRYVDGWVIDYNNLSFEKQVMLDYLNENGSNFKNKTNIICDLELAKAIYDRILEVHPKINDKLALKYLEIALDNIRNIKATDDRKNSRIRRLKLNKDFNKWNEKDSIKNFDN